MTKCGVSGLLLGLLGVGWIQGAPPANDACLNAYVIPRTGPWPHLTPTSSLADATSLPTDPVSQCQNSVTRSVWYLFIPAQTGYYSLSTCAGAPTATTEEDTVLAVFRAASCSGPFTEVACNDDNCDFQASLIAQLLANQRYYLVVWQFSDGSPSAGQVQLRVERLNSPENDDCSSAIPLELNIPKTGTSVLARNDYQLASSDCFAGIGQTASATAGGDVVYQFDAPSAGDYSFSVNNYVRGNLVLYVAGSCPSGAAPATVSCLGAANRSTEAGLSEEVPCVPLTANQRVYVFVDEPSLGVGSPFEILVTRCQAEQEPNDQVPVAPMGLCELTAWISEETDWDFYALGSLANGQRVFAMVEGESANATDFTLRVMTATDVLEFDNDDNDQVFGNSSPNIAGTPLEGGDSYLAVTLDTFTGVTSAGPYHLYAVIQPPYTTLTPETEPNDLPNLGTRGLNNYFIGLLPGPAPSADQDYYAFEAERGDLIFVSLDGDPLRDDTPIDARLVLLDPLGQLVVQVDDSNNSSSTNRNRLKKDAVSPHSPGEALVARAPVTGTYYVQVAIGRLAGNMSDGAGDYVLSISRNCVAGSAGNVTVPVINKVEGPENGVVFISIAGTPGASYRLEASSDLLHWVSRGVVTANLDGVAKFAVLPGSTTFFRAASP